MRLYLVLAVSLEISLQFSGVAAAAERGRAQVTVLRPASFPHRIWAACDFEGPTPDYGWFGPPTTNVVPAYPGNRAALGVARKTGERTGRIMTGVNPVPGPRMGKENGLYLRYFVRGSTEAQFQHFNLSREDNWHINVSGLRTNEWSEVALNFTRDARRNDGSDQIFTEGDRMDDFKIFVGRPGDNQPHELWIDDVIFFANDPALPPEREPFPNRVIFLAAFDTGPPEKYWPGKFELQEKPPPGAYWRAAGSVPASGGKSELIQLQIAPPRPVGGQTKLRFRYHLTGSSVMTVQLFDATVQDNRHVRLGDLKQGAWTTAYVDFARDSKRNDATTDSGFAAGNLVDDLFFFVPVTGPDRPRLVVDEVVLFDAAIR